MLGLVKGNTKVGSKTFSDPEKSRVVNPRGILPCLTTGGSGLVDVKELESGTLETKDKEVSVTVESDKKKCGRKGIPALQFTLDGDFIKEWESVSKAEIALGMGHQSIGKAVRGENGHKSGGFLWYRKDDPGVTNNKAA